MIEFDVPALEDLRGKVKPTSLGRGAKDRMRTLESHFYKNANPTGPPPSGSEDHGE